MAEFEWDDATLGHIARHDLTPQAVEEAFHDSRAVTWPAYSTATEERYGIVGATENRRILFVVYTYRGLHVRVVTARFAHRGELDAYLRRPRR